MPTPPRNEKGPASRRRLGRAQGRANALLGEADVLRLQTLGAAGHIELDLLTFLQ